MLEVLLPAHWALLPNMFDEIYSVDAPNTIGSILRGVDGRTGRMSCLEDDHDSVVDARDIDGEPFGEIMTAVRALDEGETLLLINSFEPVPLYDVLGNRGFEHETNRVSDDEYHVEITPE
jgi:uncharacterized protein (DUF2249 family)